MVLLLRFRNTLLIVFLLICLSCKKKQPLLIINNSDKIIYFTYSPSAKLKDFDGVLIYGRVDGDTADNFSTTSRILPNETIEVVNFASWDETIDLEFGGIIYIYFFEEDVLKKYAWQEIVYRKLYSEIHEYDKEDLVKLNWKVKYKNGSSSNLNIF